MDYALTQLLGNQRRWISTAITTANDDDDDDDDDGSGSMI